MKPLWTAGAALALSLAWTAPALAYSECSGTVGRLYVDNAGYIWVNVALAGGGEGSVEIVATNPNKLTYYSALLTAKASAKQVTFRFTKDTSTCTAVNSDLMALWLD
ncbi:MAG: hypothetical protein J7521_00115 [Caulobacter sp.]|nr:hypothetical protein [Caulobacter sp.]